MFPITNHSTHFFTSAEINKLREYVTTRTSDEIKSAEISENEITAKTESGERSFELSTIFHPKCTQFHSLRSELKGESKRCADCGILVSDHP